MTPSVRTVGTLAVALGWAGLLGSAPLAFADEATGSDGPPSTVSSDTRAGSAAQGTAGPAAARQRVAAHQPRVPVWNASKAIKHATQSAPPAQTLPAATPPPVVTPATSPPTATATASSDTGSNYDQLHRNIVIRADIYGRATAKPQILAADLGFDGITAVPGLDNENDINLAIDAGAGVVDQLVGLDPAAPFRNITSGSSPAGIQSAGFSDTVVTHYFMDALPIEFSAPVLPSTVLPQNFRVTLNTGEVVTPYYVAQNPNYDLNERQTIVTFGDYSNRLPSDDPSAVYPVLVQVVASSTPLKLITPRGLVDGTGLSKSSSSPYNPDSGPTLVGAKLSKLSLAGDYPPVGLTDSVANHGVEYYGTDPRLYRLRLFTTGGFSPNGVSPIAPQQFEKFFQLTAQGFFGKTVTVTKPNVKYRVPGGYIEVKGIADLGTGLSADPEYTYTEDVDNQLDVIVWASSPMAAHAINNVIIPAPGGTYSPIYTPGGPGTEPVPGYLYATPSPGQTMPVQYALTNPETVSWADQSLSDYDQADDLAVAFRLRNAATGEWLLTSSSANATSLVDTGDWSLVDVPFATNANDSYVADVVTLHNDSRNDTVFTTNQNQITKLENMGYVNEGAAFTAYSQPLRGLDPVWQMVSPRGQHAVTSSPAERLCWMLKGWRPQGVAFYTVSFPNAQ
jgi:hypothetical protein